MGAAATIAQSILPLLGLPIRAVGDLRRKLEAVSVSATSWSRVRLENGVNDVQFDRDEIEFLPVQLY